MAIKLKEKNMYYKIRHVIHIHKNLYIDLFNLWNIFGTYLKVTTYRSEYATANLVKLFSVKLGYNG